MASHFHDEPSAIVVVKANHPSSVSLPWNIFFCLPFFFFFFFFYLRHFFLIHLIIVCVVMLTFDL